MMAGRLVWRSGREMLRQARDREFEHLQTDPEPFAGIVWGCSRWRRCGSRIIETPPYASFPPDSRCHEHRLPLNTKIVESRIIGGGAQ